MIAALIQTITDYILSSGYPTDRKKIVRPDGILLCTFFIVLSGCSSATINDDTSTWNELTYVVNASVEVQIKLPPAKMEAELQDTQFVVTKNSPATRLFIASYDPGWGSDRDLLLTTFSAYIFQLEREGDEQAVTLDEFKSRVLFTNKKAARGFNTIGVETHSNREWLKNRLKGKQHGVTFSTVIDDDLVLHIIMTMYGKDANQTKLFEKRLETIEKLLSTVKISIVEI
jgi:hypothetical protein